MKRSRHCDKVCKVVGYPVVPHPRDLCLIADRSVTIVQVAKRILSCAKDQILKLEY
ncbi:hypothetical protein Plhal304r1_c031g0101031 [Plasmopara halstedii]